MVIKASYFFMIIGFENLINIIICIITGSDFDFGAEKKKKQQQAESETNFVLGFVRDFFAFNQHFKENKEKFILFISLTVAAGLSIFLAMFLWNMYRTNRLDRIAKSLRQPNLSQSTLCSATGKGPFTNYVYERRGVVGPNMSTFCQRSKGRKF